MPAPFTPKPTAKAPNSAKLSSRDLRGSKPEGLRKLYPILLQETPQGIRVQIALPQLCVALCLLAALAWVSLAGAAYLFVKYRRGFTEVKFSHMLFFPTQKEAYREARGDFLIQLAKNQLPEKKYQEALLNIRVGSSLSPKNRDGRLLLSQIYVLAERADLAQKNLVEGLRHHADDEEYLQTVFTFLLQRQADAEILKITDELLAAAGPEPKQTHQLWLTIMARATAHFFRGNYDAAELGLNSLWTKESIDNQILMSRINWERGDQAAALDRLALLTEQHPDNEAVYAQYASFLRKAGRNDELRRLAFLRQISFPDRPRPRIDLLYIHDLDDDEFSVQTIVEDVFKDFPADAGVMLAMSEFAANTGRPELARRVYRHCKANSMPWDSSALTIVEAYVVAERYQDALAATTELQQENPEWGKQNAPTFNGIQAIAQFGLADVEAAQLFLSNFLNQSTVRAESLVAVSNRLLSIGARSQARQVLAHAVRKDPLNQIALSELIRLDLEAGNAEQAAANLPALMAMRKPPLDLLDTGYLRLSSDQFVLTPGRTRLLDELQTALKTGIKGSIRS